MKKRFLVGRGLVATAITLAGGGALAFLPAPAGAAGTPPQISKVVSPTGSKTVLLGKPQPEATAHISPSFVAYTPTTRDEAIAATTTPASTTESAHVYLVAGSTTNPFHIETSTAGPTFGSLIVGDVYLVAGDATPSSIVGDPGGGSTPALGQSTTIQAAHNPIAPVSLAFDKHGNLLIGEAHKATGPSETGIQMVAKTGVASAYGYTSPVAGGLYDVAAGSVLGATATKAILYTFQVEGFSLAVDAAGDIVAGAQGNVLFLNETTGTITRYGKSMAKHTATVIAGTATYGSTSKCTTGGTSDTATSHTHGVAMNFKFPHPVLDASGNVIINDDRTSSTGTNNGCVWVLPANPTTTAYGVSDMHTGKVYSLTGPAKNGTAYSSGAAANVTALPSIAEVAVDVAGNLVVAQSGTTPALRVVAAHSGHFYDQTMHGGDIYTIAGGSGATHSNTPSNAAGFHLVGTAETTALPQYGVTSLTTGAVGTLLLTNGTTFTNGVLYNISKAPTAAAHPTVTSVTPATGTTNGGTIVTIHGLNLGGITAATFGGTPVTAVYGFQTATTTSVKVKTPAHGPGPVTVAVTASLGSGHKTAAYTYVAPATTHVTLTISGTRYKGTTIRLICHVTPHTAPGKCDFYTTDPSLIGTKTVTNTTGTATITFTLSATGAHKIIAKFAPTTPNAYATSTSSATATSQTFTVITRPQTGGTVRQPMYETVKAGRLTLSCTRYATVETTPTITVPPLGAAIKTCPIIDFTYVQLNGVQQTRTKAMNPIYVYTARGTAVAGWALSAAMVPTVFNASDDGTPVTPSASCASKPDFCDSTGTLGATYHGQIPAGDLTLSATYTCTPAATNHNPTPAPRTSGPFGTVSGAHDTIFTNKTLALCTAVVGTSGGKFEVSGGNFTLTIPSTVRHGKYWGTVEYTLVSIP